ncbi:MAG: hypothetical protein GEU79_13750 [Acidimicrobiia bacterium]|nr:hypothetical protein [Acidimicrobiia bacterium]
MKAHRFDALSFVFGAVFVAISVLIVVSGTGVDYIGSVIDLGRWFVAGVIAIVGLAILGSTISGMVSKPDENLDRDQ